MLFIKQPPDSDECLRAAIACLLDKQFDEVPSFKIGETNLDQSLAVRKYLNSIGYDYILMYCGPDIYWQFPRLCIVYGKSPRKERTLHAIIGRVNGWKLEYVHDPHEDNTFIIERKDKRIHIGFVVKQ